MNIQVQTPIIPAYPYTRRTFDTHHFKSKHLVGHSYQSDFLDIFEDGTITLKATKENPFYWDGCSPKFSIFGLTVIGTPDGQLDLDTGMPVTDAASMFHDILYQHLGQPGFTLTRKDCDKVFHELMGNYQLAYKYYRAVRIFGALYLRFVVQRQPKFINYGMNLAIYY